MPFCSVCGGEFAEGAKFCKACGTPVAQQQPFAGATSQQPYQSGASQVPPAQSGVTANTQSVNIDLGSDHTSLFSPEDISKNKVFALGTYVLGFVGIVVALLAARESKYAMFHAREAMKITVTQSLLVLISLFLFWTFVIPIAAGICEIVLGVVALICIFRVCKGQAKEAPIVGSMKFLK